MDNFDLKKYLVENKRTRNSKDLLIESVDFKENDKVKYKGKDYYVVVSATDNAYIEPNNFSKEFADAGTTKDSFVILSPESLEYGETLSDDQIKSALDFYTITDKSKVEPTNSRMLTEASTLSPAEDRIYRDIIAELDTLTEATFSQVLNKVKEYARKGLMTAAIVSSLLATPGITAAQAADIRQASGVETSTPGSTSSLQKTSDPISQLKKAFSGTSFTTGKYEGGSSINWGKGKPVGVFVAYDMGQPTIKITVLGANGKTSPNFNKIANDAKQLGGKFNLDSKNAMAEITVAKEKLPDIQKFIEASLPLMR